MQNDKPEAHCPQCGKGFNTKIQVQRHLNQPRAKCHQRPTAFVDPADLLEHFAQSGSDPSSPSNGSEDLTHATVTNQIPTKIHEIVTWKTLRPWGKIMRLWIQSSTSFQGQLELWTKVVLDLWTYSIKICSQEFRILRTFTIHSLIVLNGS